MKKVLYISLLLISNMAIAQFYWTSGTIHFKDGSFKSGLVKIPRYSKNIFSFNGKEMVRYKLDKETKKVKFGPDVVDLIEFLDYGTYVYVQTAYKLSLFKEIVSEGKAKLYSREISGSSPGMYQPGAVGSVGGWTGGHSYNFTEYFVKLFSDAHAEPYGNNRGERHFRKRSIEFFSACEALVEDLSNKKYKKENLIEVVEAYNACE